MSNLLDSGKIGSIGLSYMKKVRAETFKKWKELGFLDGLTGHSKENIAELFQCCKSSIVPKDNESKG